MAMPFSPRWLCSKGRSREALNSLARLRQLPEDDPKVVAEWISIRGDGTCLTHARPSAGTCG
jgi:hypothetical protein